MRNVYVSFRENITQWGRKKFMAGGLHLYAVGLAGLDAKGPGMRHGTGLEELQDLGYQNE